MAGESLPPISRIRSIPMETVKRSGSPRLLGGNWAVPHEATMAPENMHKKASPRRMCRLGDCANGGRCEGAKCRTLSAPQRKVNRRAAHGRHQGRLTMENAPSNNEASSGTSALDDGLGVLCLHEKWERVAGGVANSANGCAYLHRDRCCACGALSWRNDDNGARRIDGSGGTWSTPNVEVSGLRGFSRRSARLQGWASCAWRLVREATNSFRLKITERKAPKIRRLPELG